MKSGRLSSLKGHAEVVEPLMTAMATMKGEVARIEKKLKELSTGDRAVEILSGIPGTGLIDTRTVRAFIDDLRRLKSTMKLCRYAGLAPWVQKSCQSVDYGRTTQHGPCKPRTALVRMVLGMIKVQGQQNYNRLMLRCRQIKEKKRPGKAIIATSRKLIRIVWTFLTEDKEYFSAVINDHALICLAYEMSEKATGEMSA